MPGFKEINKFNKKINLINLNITHLSSANLFFYFINFFMDIYKIIIEIKNKKIDIVYIAGGTNCIKSVISSLIARKKFIWHVHDVNSNFILVFLFNLLKFFSEKIIFVSQKSKNFYLKKKKFKNFIILPSSVDVNFFAIKCFNKKISKKIITIANINPDKDISTLIDVVHNVEKYDKSIKFYILGKVWKSQKNYYKKIKNKIKLKKIKNLKLILKSDSVIKYLKQSDILMCTSVNESLPLSICEAMASYKAIISTDVGDIKKFIEMKNKNFGFAGKVFKKNDYLNISEYIIYLYRNKNLIKKLGINSNKVAKNYLNIASYSKKLCKILNSTFYY